MNYKILTIQDENARLQVFENIQGFVTLNIFWSDSEDENIPIQLEAEDVEQLINELKELSEKIYNKKE